MENKIFFKIILSKISSLSRRKFKISQIKKVYGGSKETEKCSFSSKEVLNVCGSIMTTFRENGPGVTNHRFCYFFCVRLDNREIFQYCLLFLWLSLCCTHCIGISAVNLLSFLQQKKNLKFLCPVNKSKQGELTKTCFEVFDKISPLWQDALWSVVFRLSVFWRYCNRIVYSSCGISEIPCIMFPAFTADCTCL